MGLHADYEVASSMSMTCFGRLAPLVLATQGCPPVREGPIHEHQLPTTISLGAKEN